MEYAENETEAVYGRLQGESSQGDAEGRKDSKENLGNARFMLMESAIYIEEQNDGKENGGNARASTTRTRAQSHSGLLRILGAIFVSLLGASTKTR